MSKKEKLIARLKSNPKDFTFDELSALLSYFGYTEDNVGKTSGSAVRFINTKSKHIIRIHKPHPSPILKAYIIKLVIDQLKKVGVL